MKPIRPIVLALSLSLCHSALAINPVEKGDLRLHTQPNEGTPVTFMAVQWGPPGLLEYEDSYGYSIIQSEVDGFWYYAILDTSGEYTSSNAKVAIDNPPVAAHLRRSEGRVNEILGIIDEHNRARWVIADKWRYMWSLDVNTTITVAVLLLNFTDPEAPVPLGSPPVDRVGRTDGSSFILIGAYYYLQSEAA